MRVRLDRWRAALGELTEEYTAAFGDLSAGALNWKPGPGRWSVAQVLDHVITANRSYYPTFQEVRDGRYRAPWVARIPGLPAAMGNLILRMTLPEQRHRSVKTFSAWEPARSDLPGDIVDRFVEEQGRLSVALSGLEPFLESGLVITSPANRYIPYPLTTAVEILLAHEHRHLLQGREVRALRASREGA